MNLEQLKPYVKTLVAFAIGALQVAQVYFTLSGDGSLDAVDINTLINTVILALGGTVGVYALPNRQSKG